MKFWEVSPQKQIVWRYKIPFPYLATRLENGNTLMSSGDGYGSPRGYYVIEGRSRRQNRLEVRRRRCAGGSEAELAFRIRAIHRRQHVCLRGTGRRYQGDLAG